MTFTRRQKHEAAQREVKMRKRVYPSQVRQEKMTQEGADYQIAVMAAIATDYDDSDLFAARAKGEMP